jgi:hypothetical protein
MTSVAIIAISSGISASSASRPASVAGILVMKFFPSFLYLNASSIIWLGSISWLGSP